MLEEQLPTITGDTEQLVPAMIQRGGRTGKVNRDRKMDTLGPDNVVADWVPGGWKECKAAHYLEYILAKLKLSCSDASFISTT